MVKKHLPVTKLVARNANKSARAVQLPFISWLSAACGCGRCRAGCAAFRGKTLACRADGRPL